MPLFNQFRALARAFKGQESAPSQMPAVTPFNGGKVSSFANPPAPNATQMAEAGMSLPKVTILPPVQPGDGSLEEMAIEYFGRNAMIRGRQGQLLLNVRFPMSKPILGHIIDTEEKAAGPLWNEEDIAALKIDFGAWQSAQDLLDEFTYANVAVIFRRKMENISAAVSRGEHPGDPPVVDRAQQEMAIWAYRKAIRDGLIGISARAYARLVPKCERLRLRARMLAFELDKKEREAAQTTGLPFEPSPSVKSILFFALLDWESPIQNYFPGVASNFYPSNTFFGREIFKINAAELKQSADAGREALMTEAGKFLAEKNTSIAREQNEDLAGKSKDHAATAKKPNTLHDTLRAPAQPDSQ